MVKGFCEYCGKEITADRPSNLHRFCSHKCSNRWKWENVRKRAETITIPCANCGKPVVREAHDWRFKKGVKLIFCCNDCHTQYSRAHRTPNVCQFCGKEFMHKYHNTKYCSNECKTAATRLSAYRRLYDPLISKDDFLRIYENGKAFVFAGRESEYLKEYNDTNHDSISEKRKRRLENDEVADYALKIKKQVQQVYARRQKRVKEKLYSILGCQADEFVSYIDSLLKDGMTPDNYGEWQLDHIEPISSARTREEVERLCHYTNYQPLWKIDNRKKGSKKPTEPI